MSVKIAYGFWKKKSAICSLSCEKKSERNWPLHRYIEKPTHPKRVTVWRGFWSRRIIGPFFIENEQGVALTVNGDRYGAMLNKFFVSKTWRKGYRQHLVSTGPLYVPHSWTYTRYFATCFWRSHYQPQSRCRLATLEWQFDTVELLFVVCRHR